jgi:hypothetical protein
VSKLTIRRRLDAMKTETLVVIGLFTLLTVMLTALKLVNPSDQRGDTAFYEQTTENIAHRGVAVSALQADILAFFDAHLTTLPADKVATAPLAPPAAPEINVLRWHEYLILYPAALLVELFPSDVVLFALDVLSFTGLLVLAYFILRRKGLPIAGAALFCLLVVSHPAWSDSLLSGQFYPDRVFVLAGFVLMYLATALRAPWSLLVATGVVAASVNERGGITGGLFLLAFVALYWRELPKPARTLRLCLGIAMLAYGTIIIKLVITNFYYSTFLPQNLSGVLASFLIPNFEHNFWIYVLVNSALLLLAMFEWRAAAIALLLMMPNLLGNIGGAEKVGWTTHYHTYYLPGLIWAAMLGYTNLYRIVSASRRRTLALYGLAVALALFMSSINPYTGQLAVGNISANFLMKFWNASTFWFTPGRMVPNPLSDEFNRAVPPGSVVSAPEIAMPYLFRNRTVRYYPIDIDHADYAVLSAVRGKGTAVTYGGAISYLGPDEQKKVDAVLVARMRKDGYDFDHPTFIPEIGAAVVKRKH